MWYQDWFQCVELGLSKICWFRFSDKSGVLHFQSIQKKNDDNIYQKIKIFAAVKCLLTIQTWWS